MDKRLTLGALVVAVVGLGAIFYFMGSTKLGVTVGDKALDITLGTLDGSTFRLSDQRGKLVVIDFATTACPYCVEEFKALQELAGKPGVVVVTVNLDDSNSTYLTGFAAENGITWNVGTGIGAGIDYRVDGVPTLVLVDKAGIIRYRDYYTSLDALNGLLALYG